MKRLSKILMLVLVVALTLGCVFAIASSAADEPTGVTTSTVDFTGMTDWIAWKQMVPNIGVHHVVSAGGNSYFEWTNYTDPGQVKDAQYRYFPNDLVYGDYGIIEFDIATSTSLSNGFVLDFYYTGRDIKTNAQSGEDTFRVLEVVSGQLTSQGKVIPANTESDWTHITIVIDGVQNTGLSESIGADGLPTSIAYTSYADTVIKVFADGKLISTSKPFEAKDFFNFKRVYIGWPYNATDPIEAGTSIAIDNWTETYCKEYLGTDEADLSQLFGENAITDLANYTGTEVKFNANGYTYPPAMGNVYVATASGNVTYKTVQAAIDAIANLEVEGDIHLVNAEGVVAEDGTFTGLPSANVTVPVTIYTHGKAIAKPTVAGAVIETVGQDDVGETVYTYEADASVTIEYYPTYDDAYNMTNMMMTIGVKEGQTPTAPVIKDVYDKESGKVTLFKGWQYYVVDENEELVAVEALPEITEELYGTIYCAVAETEVSDVLFYTILGDEINYYASASDFTSANLMGKTVVLGGNVTASETLTNVKIDLNGYILESGAINLFNGGYVYSSAAGGTLINGGNLHSTDAGDKLYLGYINESTKSDYRINLVVSLIAPTRNDQTFMYGCDVFTTRDYQASDAQAGALFSNSQARTKIIRIDNCNFYCNADTRVFTAHKTSSYDAVVTNTNFYGKGTLISYKLYDVSGIVVKLENVHTYGEFQMIGNTGIKLDVGAGCSFANYNAQNVNSIASGYWVVETDAKVTLADQTYVKTIGGETLTFAGGEFAVGNVVEKAPVKATFNFYDVAIEDVVTATPVFSQTKYLGETPTAPMLSAKQENGKFYNVAGWIVYDGETELGALSAVTEEMNNKTLYVCPVWEEVEVAFAIVDGEIETLYPETSLVDAIVAGKVLKLYADVTVVETLTNVTIDLNGYKFHSTATSGMLKGNKNYIYNSNTEVAATLISDQIVLVTGNDVNYQVHIGYTASGVKATEGGKINMTAPQFTHGKTTNTLSLYNVDFYNTTANDYSSDKGLFWMQVNRAMTVNIDNCNFYMIAAGAIIGGNNCAGSGYRLTMTNTNIYGTGAVYSGIWSGSTDLTGTGTFNNVKLYGGFVWFGNGQGGDFSNRIKLVLDANCEFSSIRGTYELPEGMVLVPSTEKVTLDKTFVGADGTVYEMKGEYATGLKVGTPEEKDAFIKAVITSSYRNVNLDVNINYNLYIPTTYSVAGATETITIGETEYWVLTFAKAPKDAIGDNVVTVTVNGLAIEYNASVVNYVKALMDVTSESEYAVASKNVAKYVLNYIKTVAVAANAEADVTAINEILAGFVAEIPTVEGAIENVTPITGVVGVALDLNSQVGMVIQVAKDYVGTITVSMNGAETVTETYEAAAEADRYIVIGDIEIFNFINDVTITNGTETMTYNLATYVKNINDKADASAEAKAVANATYAYAVQAKAYHVTYGAPTTID